MHDGTDQGMASATATRYVGGSGPGNFSTIQAAIDNASHGDIIRVYTGMYNENIIVNKTVTLIGNGTSDTIINGSGVGDTVYVDTDWVNISGFNIIKSGTSWLSSGIELNYAQNCSIYNNNLSDNYFGVSLVDSFNNTFSNNNLTSNNYLGFYLERSKDNTLINNTCNSNFYYGMYFTNSDSNEIINCTCSDNYYGMFLSLSDQSQIINTQCNDNDYYGLYISQSHQHTIKNVTCNSNGYEGIRLYATNDNTISNCTINWNNNIGIYIGYSMRNKLFNNTMLDSGISFEGNLVDYWNSNYIDTGNLVNNRSVYYIKNQSNVIISQGSGQIILANCTDITIKDQNLSDCSMGVHAGYCRNITLFNITGNLNYYGVYLFETDNNNITNCTFEMNENAGIYLYYSDKNTITNCTTNLNIGYGIFINRGDNSKIIDSTVNNNNNMGIYYSYSNYAIVQNTTTNFNNPYGMYIQNSDRPIVLNCISNNNTGRGILIFFSGSSQVINNTANGNDNAGIWVDRSSSHLVFNNTCTDNFYGIYLNSIIDGTISNCTSNNNEYSGIHSWNSRSVAIANNTCNGNIESGIYLNGFRDYILINNNCSNSNDGIYLAQVGDCEFINNTYHSNIYNGIYSLNSNSIMFERDQMISNLIGINFSGGNDCNIINSSIINSSSLDVYLNQNAYVTVLNSSLNRSKILYEDEASSIMTQWFMHVNVTNDTGVPISNASVEIKDIVNSSIYTGATDADGWRKWIVCDEYLENKSGQLFTYTPHNVTVSKIKYEDASAAPEPFMDNNRIVNLTLLNDTTHPAPPNDLIFHDISHNYLNFSWMQHIPDDVFGYNIYINDTGSSTQFHYIGSTLSLFFKATGLADETTYYFQITAYDDVPLESVPLTGFRSTLDNIPPEPPTGLLVSDLGGTYINLSWTESISTDVMGYEIHVNNTDSIINFHLLAVTSNNYFNHTGLPEETSNIYRIYAFDEVPLYSSFVVYFVTTLDITPPTPPTGLQVEDITGTGVRLTWSASSSSDLTGYHILINNTGKGITGPFHSIKSVWSTNTEYSVNGLIEDTGYYFVVVAFDEVGLNSSYSNIVWAKTLDNVAPTAPTGLNATALSSTEIYLTWDPNPETDITGYILFMNDTNNGSTGNFHIFKTLYNTTTNYTIVGLIEEASYHFKIKAFDEVPNTSPFSNVKSIFLSDITPPSAPTGINVAVLTFYSLRISWNANLENDLVGYYIYRTKSLTGQYTAINTIPIKNTYYNDTNLTDHTTYYYKISAVDNVNLESPLSKLGYATTPLGAHGPEINNSIADLEIPEDSYDDRSINLYKWFKDINGDELEFKCSGQNHINVIIYQKNGTVLLRPDANWNGVENLTFYASDGVFNFSDSVNITIMPVNDPPEHVMITNPEVDSIIVEGEKLTFNGSCIDPDIIYGDKLTYRWYSNLTGELGQGEIIRNISLPFGEHLITLLVTDLSDETALVNIRVWVLESGDSDSDADGLPNYWERKFALNQNDPKDALLDPDNDTLTNLDEFENNTNPQNNDTDDDGLIDPDEINTYGTLPDDPDTDEDTFSDGKEVEAGTDPLNASSYPIIDENKSWIDTDPMYESLGLLALFIILIIVILIVSQLLLQRKKAKDEEKENLIAKSTKAPARKEHDEEKLDEDELEDDYDDDYDGVGEDEVEVADEIDVDEEVDAEEYDEDFDEEEWDEENYLDDEDFNEEEEWDEEDYLDDEDEENEIEDEEEEEWGEEDWEED